MYTSLQQVTCVLYCGPIFQVNDSVYVKFGGHWSCLAGGRLAQRLFCTKSSVQGISVIKTTWFLTTEIINRGFYFIPYSV